MIVDTVKIKTNTSGNSNIIFSIALEDNITSINF